MSEDSAKIRHKIRKLMNDPRYWRDRDPSIVAEVNAEFAKIKY